MKIFCIGLNKTGTSSLHLAFKRLGFKSLHYAPDGIHPIDEYISKARDIRKRIKKNINNDNKILSGLEEFDVFSDIELISRNIRLLDEHYPNSKFIYTNRNVDEWVTSRKMHVIRKHKSIHNGYRTDLGCEIRINETKWKKHFISHRKNILKYFSNRNSFLMINICDGEGYEKLCPFLNMDPIFEDFPNIS